MPASVQYGAPLPISIFSKATSEWPQRCWRADSLCLHMARSRNYPIVAKVGGNYRRSHSDPYQHLAEVLALQHANKRSRRFFQPVNNIFAIFEATSSHPLTHIAQKVWLFRGKIGNNEPTQEKALAQHRKHVGAGHRAGRIVLRDQAAHWNARKIVE